MRLLLLVKLVSIVSFISAQDIAVVSTDPGIKMADLFNASENKKVSCYRIPSLATAVNGDLIAAIDERVPSCGDLKWSRDINIVIRRSFDDGVSWSSIERVLDFPDGQSASDPSMIVDRVTGNIFLFYNYMDHDREKDVYYLHYIKSKDHGATWSLPVDITNEISKPVWLKDFKFITSGRGIQTSTGKLLHCMVNLDNGMHVFGSDDHGKSWYLIDTPIKPANESKIVELSDGSWMINSRVQGKGHRYVHKSIDQGKTWISVADTSLVDPSCNASIIRYSNDAYGPGKNILLFSNAKDSQERKNMCVRISLDNGVSWSEGKTIYEGSSAYSSLTILKNGNIGLLFEKNNYKENVFVSFSLDYLITDTEK